MSDTSELSPIIEETSETSSQSSCEKNETIDKNEEVILETKSDRNNSDTSDDEEKESNSDSNEKNSETMSENTQDETPETETETNNNTNEHDTNDDEKEDTNEEECNCEDEDEDEEDDDNECECCCCDCDNENDNSDDECECECNKKDNRIVQKFIFNNKTETEWPTPVMYLGYILLCIYIVKMFFILCSMSGCNCNRNNVCLL